MDVERLFPPVDPDRPSETAPRRRLIPFRVVLPNLLTLVALTAGLTAIRMAMEGRFELAVAAIVFAAVLDAIDGRVARMIKGTSKFGEQLDSLADFVDFGVAPAMLLYIWILADLGSLGWIAALAFAICAGLRLARFNAALSDESAPAWHKDFFVGMPAPAGAIVVLLPLSFSQAVVPVPPEASGLVALYTVAIGLLMVSRFPTLSGKRTGTRISRAAVLPFLVVAVLLIALLVSYPFTVLVVGSVLYLAHLPFAWRAWRREEEADRRGRPSAGTVG